MPSNKIHPHLKYLNSKEISFFKDNYDLTLSGAIHWLG